ncbi:MAG: hypothetical protein ABI600_08580 [Luteolibacter sp.]
MKKLTLGKKTLQSIHLQLETILKSVHGEEIKIKKVKPQRTGTGNFLLAKYRTVADPQLTRSRYFAMVRIGECCDIWLEKPETHRELHEQRNSMKSRARH